MGLWAGACAIAVSIHLASAGNRFLVPHGLHPGILVASSLLGLASALCPWQAFFSRRRRAPQAAAAS